MAQPHPVFRLLIRPQLCLMKVVLSRTTSQGSCTGLRYTGTLHHVTLASLSTTWCIVPWTDAATRVPYRHILSSAHSHVFCGGRGSLPPPGRSSPTLSLQSHRVLWISRAVFMRSFPIEVRTVFQPGVQEARASCICCRQRV